MVQPKFKKQIAVTTSWWPVVLIWCDVSHFTLEEISQQNQMEIIPTSKYFVKIVPNLGHYFRETSFYINQSCHQHLTLARFDLVYQNSMFTVCRWCFDVERLSSVSDIKSVETVDMMNFNVCTEVTLVFLSFWTQETGSKRAKGQSTLLLLLLFRDIIPDAAADFNSLFCFQTSWWPLHSLWCLLSSTLWVKTHRCCCVRLKLGRLFHRWEETSQNSRGMPNHQGESWKTHRSRSSCGRRGFPLLMPDAVL